MTTRDKYALNKNFVLDIKLDPAIPLEAALRSAWRVVLGRGWSLVRRNSPHLKEGPLGIELLEGTNDEFGRTGIGYRGFEEYEYRTAYGCKRVHLWEVQPSELAGHPAFNASCLGCGFLVTWGSELRFGFHFDYEKGSDGVTIGILTTSKASGYLEGHCFYPHALKQEEYATALEAYEVLKELSILWRVSECFGRAYLDEEHPEEMFGRQFQFGWKRPNRLITFFEERRMPNAEELSDGLYAVERNVPLAKWIVEVPPGEHFLPSDPKGPERLEAILAERWGKWNQSYCQPVTVNGSRGSAG